MDKKPLVVAIMPARNNAKTLRAAVQGIPAGCVDAIVLVDNNSRDETATLAEEMGLNVVRHASDRGYGGSLKSCLDRALELGADVVVEIHPDDQYGADVVPEMVRRARESGCALVLGSRFIPPKRALAGGMPLWKYLSNRALSRINGWLLGVPLTEFHTGLRVYDAGFLRSVAYRDLSDDFAFSFEIIAEAVHRHLQLAEVPATARYFPEASSNGFLGSLKYGLETVATSIRHRLRRR